MTDHTGQHSNCRACGTSTCRSCGRPIERVERNEFYEWRADTGLFTCFEDPITRVHRPQRRMCNDGDCPEWEFPHDPHDDDGPEEPQP